LPRLSKAAADLVALDGLPRLVTADDASQHVLYLNGAVRSMLASDWPPPLPSDPTPQQIATAIAARQAAEAKRHTDAIALRQRVIGVAQTTVGQPVDAPFTTAQLRALLAVLLYKAGALDDAGVIKELNQWL
jgi:hypothetical protein